METISSSLAQLEIQVKQLIDLHTQAQREISALQLSHQQLVVDKEEQQGKISALSEQLKTFKLAQALTGSGEQETREVKVKINEYIKEIDKCLALLNT